LDDVTTEHVGWFSVGGSKGNDSMWICHDRTTFHLGELLGEEKLCGIIGIVDDGTSMTVHGEDE